MRLLVLNHIQSTHTQNHTHTAHTHSDTQTRTLAAHTHTHARTHKHEGTGTSTTRIPPQLTFAGLLYSLQYFILAALLFAPIHGALYVTR